MARPTVLKICFVIAALSCIGIGSAMAADSTSITGTYQLGGGTFSPSNKVTLHAAVGPTAACNPSIVSNLCTEYTAKTKHGSGDRVHATNNKDPKIYFKTVASTATLESVAATEVFTDTAAWTAM